MARLSNETARKTVGTLEGLLRAGIARGEYSPGQLLPSARELSRRHGIGPRSVRHALRALEEDALVAVEARRGYRVLAPREVAGKGAALAFVVPRHESSRIGDRYPGLLEELQGAAGACGRPLLAVGGKGVSPEDVITQLKSHAVRGAIVSGYDPALLEAMSALEVPIVAVDVWHPGLQVDTVVQDGFVGGYLAGEYLIEKGHELIAYAGRRVPRELGLLAADRLGGAVSGLADRGLDLPADMRVLDDAADAAASEGAIEKLLSAATRPTAVIALWAPLAAMVTRVADRLGLKLGQELEVVGWGIEERLEREAGGPFPQGYRPPTITWSVRQMAEMAVARLEQRRNAPGLPPTVSKLPVRLRLSQEREGSE